MDESLTLGTAQRSGIRTAQAFRWEGNPDDDREDFGRFLAEYSLPSRPRFMPGDSAPVDDDDRGLILQRSQIEGFGLFASEPVRMGRRLRHNCVDLFTNHSASPNAMFARSGPFLELEAMQDIPAGAEVCGDYRQFAAMAGIAPRLHETALTLGMRLKRLWLAGCSPLDDPDPPFDALSRMVVAIFGRFGYLPPMEHILDWTYFDPLDC